LAVLTFKTQQTSSPQYLNQHISLRTSARNTRSSSVPLLCVPLRRTSFARRSFSTAAPLTWNSLPPAVLNCDCLSLLSNPDLKLICFLPLSANYYSTYLFRQRLCSRLTALWRYINFVLLLLLLWRWKYRRTICGIGTLRNCVSNCSTWNYAARRSKYKVCE